MELAKISTNGQITVPIEIRKMLGVKAGDKLLFYQNEMGDVVVNNASNSTLEKARADFAGLAKELGVTNSDDVQKLVDEIRHAKKK